MKGRTILLVGPSSSGKSTVTFGLMEQGAKVFSGNTTLLAFPPGGTLQALAGTSTFTAQATPETMRQHPHAITYGTRLAAPFPCPPQGPLTVDAIALVRLNDGVTETRRLTPQSALHTLFPIVLDQANAPIIVGNGTGVINPPVAAQALTFLARNLAHQLEVLPTWHLAGSLNHITREIETCL